MELSVALAHIVGSLIGSIYVTVMAISVGSWEQERYKKRSIEELSLRLGVSPDSLDDEELSERVFEVISEKFSSDLLRNRISDLLGFVATLWGWVGSLLQLGFLVWVAWITFTEDMKNGIYSWSIVGIGLFFWISTSIFSLLCMFLTGRYPGQAKQARKSLVEYLKSRTAIAR